MPSEQRRQPPLQTAIGRGKKPKSITFFFPRSSQNVNPTRFSIPLSDLEDVPAFHALCTLPFRESETNTVTFPGECARSFVLLARHLSLRHVSLRHHPLSLPLTAERWGVTGLMRLCATHFAQTLCSTEHRSAAGFTQYWLQIVSFVGISQFPAQFRNCLALRTALCFDRFFGDANPQLPGFPFPLTWKGLWAAISEQGMLPLVLHYLSRYGGTDNNITILFNVLLDHQPEMSDKKLLQMLSLLDWQSPNLSSLLQDSSFQLESPQTWQLMVRAALSTGLRLNRYAYHMRWRLGQLVHAVRNTPTPYVQKPLKHIQNGIEFSASFSCTTFRTRFMAPLWICVRAQALDRICDLKRRRKVEICLDFVEDGCVCAVWGNKVRSFSRGKKVYSRGDIRLYDLFSERGVSIKVMNGPELSSWEKKHRDGCGLIIVLRIFELNEEQFVDVFEETEKNWIRSGYENEENRDLCYCAGCKEFREYQINGFGNIWENGIDMSGSDEYILGNTQMEENPHNVVNEDREERFFHNRVILNSRDNGIQRARGDEEVLHDLNWGSESSDFTDCYCCHNT